MSTPISIINNGPNDVYVCFKYLCGDFGLVCANLLTSFFGVCKSEEGKRERERGREQNKKMNFLNEWQMLRASKFVSSYVLFLTTNNNSTIAVKSESNPDWLSTQSRENVRLFFCRSLALPHFLSRKYQLLQINRL